MFLTKKKNHMLVEVSERSPLSEPYQDTFEATQNRKKLCTKLCTALVQLFCRTNGAQWIEERILSNSKPDRTSRLRRNHQDILEINSSDSIKPNTRTD